MVVNYENIPLSIFYIVLWCFTAGLFYLAGIMKLKEDEEKCNKCKYKYVCKGTCVNPDGRYNIK